MKKLIRSNKDKFFFQEKNLKTYPTFLFSGLLITFFLILQIAAAGEELIPFPIAEKLSAECPFVFTPEPIKNTDSWVVAKDSHFYKDNKRVKIWGVNLAFSANFPSEENAAALAERLASLGVNSIRCHHMDTRFYPDGLVDKDKDTINPDVLKRLDYLISKMADKGIFVNINLHVGREHSKFLKLPEVNNHYDKIVGIFTPQLIDAQKKFARELLTHVNPYRQKSYADDPAVAFVEISNEDSLFMWDGDEKLRSLPIFYNKILTDKYNAWLKSEYTSDANLKKVWDLKAQPLGANLLENSDLKKIAKKNLPERWNLEQHEKAKAVIAPAKFKDTTCIKIDVQNAEGPDWHLQFNQNKIKIEKGQYYTVTFKAAADMERKISASVSQAHEPWQNLGAHKQFTLTPEIKTYSFGFSAKETDDNARISFSFCSGDVDFYISEIKLQQGGKLGLDKGESLDKKNIALFNDFESDERAIDRLRFLADTEKSYYDEMKRFIKEDIKCKALVTGTIAFGPLGLYAQSGMDFVDTHAYWQHPHFPGKPWDMENWLVNQVAMTDSPERNNFLKLASVRLAGKPFSVSEYNHPAPNDFQAECIPMIASYADLQDWDAIWVFAYRHNGKDFSGTKLDGFFDICGNTAKSGFMPAGAHIFRDSGILPLKKYLQFPITDISKSKYNLAIAELKNSIGKFPYIENSMGVTFEDAYTKQFWVTLNSSETINKNSAAKDSQSSLKWAVKDKKGAYIAEDKNAYIFTGYKAEIAEMSGRKVMIDSPDFAAATMTKLNADKEGAPARILITACGRCENTEMNFSKDRKTVGKNWGKAPVLIEPVQAKIILPEGKWICRSLDNEGKPKGEVPVETTDGKSYIRIKKEYATIWYLLEEKK